MSLQTQTASAWKIENALVKSHISENNL